MPRYFNTAGPCHPTFHYMLPPEARLPGLDELVDRRLYFVLHAPRQVGKTTAMMACAQRLRERGLLALYASLETSRAMHGLEESELVWLSAIHNAAEQELPPGDRPDHWQQLSAAPGARLHQWLTSWCQRLGRPLVLLLDEVDVIAGDPLVNFLSQLRAGYSRRLSLAFPVSVALIGMRDLRDWLVASKDGPPLNAGSPFNIVSASLTMANFSPSEVTSLLSQHTTDTGQRFDTEAGSRVWWHSRGQPFLVNKLADGATARIRDRSTTIPASVIDDVAQDLILSRTTHLEVLASRLAEPRVARVIQQVALGDSDVMIDTASDDFDYVVDLGLLDPRARPPEIANPIYREVIMRQLTITLHDSLTMQPWPWRLSDGRLDMDGLIDGFLQWWRENAKAAEQGGPAQYPEILPHLAFMAFLQRVVNGGGRVEREYAAGRGRIDLVVHFGAERHVVELKRVRPGRSRDKVVATGTDQLTTYLGALGTDEGWLLVFDQNPTLTWDDRLWRDDLTHQGRRLHLRGA